MIAPGPTPRRAASTSGPGHGIAARWTLVLMLALGVFLGPAVEARAATRYDAVFGGDATGRSDVTSSLRSFLQRHDGDRVALAKGGTYRVTQLSFTAHDLTVDFRGARIRGTREGRPRHPTRPVELRNVVLNDPKVYGTGYSLGARETEQEHGIQIDGGSEHHPQPPDHSRYPGRRHLRRLPGTARTGHAVRYRHPTARTSSAPPATASRPVAGQVTIRGGHIAHTGLHGVDFEVNDDASARSIQGVVDGVDIRHTGDLPAAREHCTCYAVAAEGYSTATKPSIRVEGLTGDVLRMTIRHTAQVVVRDNVSGARATARFPGSDSVIFSGNTRITRQ